jgi:hypothetical protein
MTFDTFTSLLAQCKPDAIAIGPHGRMTNTRCKMAVCLKFSPNGKVYEYTGSYEQVLARFGGDREWAVGRAVYGTDGRILGHETVARFWTKEEAEEALPAIAAEHDNLADAWGYDRREHIVLRQR